MHRRIGLVISQLQAVGITGLENLEPNLYRAPELNADPTEGANIVGEFDRVIDVVTLPATKGQPNTSVQIAHVKEVDSKSGSEKWRRALCCGRGQASTKPNNRGALSSDSIDPLHGMVASNDTSSNPFFVAAGADSQGSAASSTVVIPMSAHERDLPQESQI